MKRRIIALLAALNILIIPLACVQSAYADDEDAAQDAPAGIEGAFEITDYVMNIEVKKDHSYSVEENVSVNIPGDIDSLTLTIPSGNFRMSGLTVEDALFSSSVSTSSSKVTITDKDQLTAGSHTFTVKFDIWEFTDRDEARDILYYSILQPGGKQPVAHLSANITFPEDFPVSELKCYSGQLGIQDEESRVSFSTSKKKHTASIEGSMLPENYGITIQAELENGYWEGALDGIWAAVAMILAAAAVVVILFILWMIGGRDPKIRKSVETRPIEGVSAEELGYIFNSELGVRDLVRLILYFGTKGYLRISEYEPKRYRLIRLNDPEGEAKHIRNAYSILFEDVYKGRALEMDKFGERLVRMESSLKDAVAAGFTDKEMSAYTPLSRIFRIAGIVMIAFLAAICNALKYSYQYISINYAESFIIGIITAALTLLICYEDDRKYSSSENKTRVPEILGICLIGGLIIFLAAGIAGQTGQIAAAVLVALLMGAAVFLVVIMRARGKGNAALVTRFRQLRRFIYHPTPKELLVNYLEDSNYYYDMLLYALTFGAEESWAISFITLDVPEPEWYSDDIEGHAFSNLRDKPTTIDYARDLRSFARTIEGAYTDMIRHRRRG